MFASSMLAIFLASSATATAVLRNHGLAQVVSSCIVPNTVALTFDDGPWKYLYNISKTLIAADAKGTFFFNGNNWDCIYNEDARKRVKYAYDKGHQVASHTWSHAHLPKLTWDQLHNEFWRVEQALIRIAGTYPAFARPPYGEYNDMVREVAQMRGQTLVNWDFDSGDSIGKSAQDSMRTYNRLVQEHPDTILALNHEVYEETAHVVIPHAIKIFQDAGYKLVTVAECLGMPAYQNVSEPEIDDGSWTC
ncbi:Chitin deacetylase [Termitomyces sp. T112]|nr:Chitin deacetylase [Termitomyces sp. T112]